jgi:hypothetical protein
MLVYCCLAVYPKGKNILKESNYSAFLFMSLISPSAKNPIIIMAMIIQPHTKKESAKMLFLILDARNDQCLSDL